MAAVDLKERILEAAAQILRENGPRPRLITAIAERAQVSRPTLYRHFPARADLYDSLIRVEVTRLVEEIANRAVTTTSPREDYVDIVVSLVHEGRTHSALQAVLARHPEILATHLPRILPITLEIAEPRLVPILDAGTREGRWPAIAGRAAIAWTVRLVATLITMPLPEDTAEVDLRRTVEALLDVASTIAGTTPAPV